MKTVAEINPKLQMSKEDFLTLFAHLPLLEDEKKRLESEYFVLYELCLNSDVEPIKAWITAKNAFLNVEKQIGTRNPKTKIIGLAGKTSKK